MLCHKGLLLLMVLLLPNLFLPLSWMSLKPLPPGTRTTYFLCFGIKPLGPNVTTAHWQYLAKPKKKVQPQDQQLVRPLAVLLLHPHWKSKGIYSPMNITIEEVV